MSLHAGQLRRRLLQGALKELSAGATVRLVNGGKDQGGEMERACGWGLGLVGFWDYGVTAGYRPYMVINGL